MYMIKSVQVDNALVFMDHLAEKGVVRDHITSSILAVAAAASGWYWMISVHIISLIISSPISSSMSRVKNEHLLQQINCHRMGLGIKKGKLGSRRVWERFDVISCLRVINELDILFPLAAKDVDNQFKLVKTFCAGEDWFPSQQFGKYAANRPDIDRSSITITAEEQFWCTVPTRSRASSHDEEYLQSVDISDPEATAF
nr:hypothetical protein Iba_chr01bCG16370 [Ipomoea batatas]